MVDKSSIENSLKTIKTLLANRNHGMLCLFVAIFFIMVATLARVWPLGALELRIPWVTFYPAVMATALYGGFPSGIFATALSTLVVLFWSPTGQPFIDDPGDWLGLVVFSVNGTLISLMSGAMHHAKAQATKAKNQAEAANQAKSTFLANMSHELRTPLNAILGFTNLMRKNPSTPPKQLEMLNIVSNSGENLLHLINNVLDISKIEAGHMLKEETEINLTQFLHEIISLMSVKAGAKGLKLKEVLAADLPQAIKLDAGKVRQILTNLIGNAITYCNKGEVSLKVTVVQQESPLLALLRFEVQDSGIGISPENQQKIFSPFEQTANLPSKKGGTGLGLAICKQYIEFLGSHIDISSELGEGALFHFDLPVEIASPVNSVAVPKNKQVIGLAEGQQLYRLLITEDRSENRLLLQNILEPLGFDLRLAVNGEEAVQQFHQWHPHLIWMDIRMPVMDGLEATRHIKGSAAGSNTKIIALTAHALEEERLEVLAAGCDDFIRKPYRAREIFDALTKHLAVRFLYKQEPTLPTIKKRTLDKKQLRDLPSTLIRKLREATILLDEALCLEAIGMISDHNYQLAKNLRHMVEEMLYQEIIMVLDEL